VYWRSGLIVTVDHALTREDSITITLADDKTVPVTIAGRLIRGGALMTVEIIVSEKPGREA
jgi:hypothetical protein